MYENIQEKIIFCNFDSIYEYLGSYSNILIVSGNGPESKIASNIYSTISKNLSCSVNTLTVPRGESAKSLEVLTILWDVYHKFNLDRSSLVLSVGGGALSDVVGFACSTYMRGINFSCCPTTLLSMVDASVGGKRAVNMPYAKNLIGSFYSARHIFIDVNIVNDLPMNLVNDGLCEISKMAFVFDDGLYDKLIKCDIKDSNDLRCIIDKCINLKQSVVQQDFYDLKDERIVLNYGHSLAHVLEKALKKDYVSHGLAVAVGMDFACFFSGNQNVLKAQRLVFDKFTLSENIKNIKNIKKAILNEDIKNIEGYLSADKKINNGKLKFVYLKTIGDADIKEIKIDDIIVSLLKYLNED